MKRFINTTAMLALCAAMQAQSAYDAQNIANTDLNGTARYIGMGGALGALGADLSTMSNNPAGTGLYRRSDASFTFGGVFTSNAGAMGHDRSRASIDQAGVLFVLGGDEGNLRNINFGINYQKRRNFLSNYSGSIDLMGGSQTFQLAQMGTDAYHDNNAFGHLANLASPNYFDDGEYPGILGSNYDLFKPLYDEYSAIYDEEMAKANPDQNRIDEAWNRVPIFQYYGFPANSSSYQRATYGSNSQIDFNLSANISDRFFAGLSVGVYTMNYDREAMYSEKNGYSEYTLRNKYHFSADGIDVKFGVIFRPVEDSPFRIGLTAHTPVWYRIRDYNSVNLEAQYGDGNKITPNTIVSDEYEYNMRTPWKFGISLGHTVGNFLAMGLEYEYSDMASCKYYYSKGGYASSFDPMNGNIKANLKGQHTVKVGVEVKPDAAFSVRAGYNFISSPFKNDAYNHLDYDGSFTETDYTNWKDTHRLTLGVGYRYKGGYIDLAYQYQIQNGDFYAYDYGGDYKIHTITGNVGTPTATKISNNRSQVVATLGFKF